LKIVELLQEFESRHSTARILDLDANSSDDDGESNSRSSVVYLDAKEDLRGGALSDVIS
jgi:hypothetical protein